MRFMFRIVVSLLFTFPALVHVQEVNTLTSLSSERQTELRHPPAPPLEYKDGKCIGVVSTVAVLQRVRQTNVSRTHFALARYRSLRRKSIGLSYSRPSSKF